MYRPTASFFSLCIFIVAGCTSAMSGNSSLRAGDDCVPDADDRCLPPDAVCAEGDDHCADEPPTIMGCDRNEDCPDAFFCRDASGSCHDGSALDDGSATGICTPIPEVCEDIASPVCGCDGTVYGNACEAAAASVSVGPDSGCHTADPCEAQDARGRGTCEPVLGYVWDGNACEPLVGCECAGSACDALYASPDECIEAHLWCDEVAPDICEPADARGVGDCDAHFGYAWNGASCESIDGCGCEGADCAELFESQATCEAERAVCGATGGGATGGGATCTDIACDEDSYPSGGECRPRPAFCTEEAPLVCGCDGITYANGCIANANGAEVAYDGRCEEPAVECRTDDDCGRGESCIECWGAPACMPTGTDC